MPKKAAATKRSILKDIANNKPVAILEEEIEKPAAKKPKLSIRDDDNAVSSKDVEKKAAKKPGFAILEDETNPATGNVPAKKAPKVKAPKKKVEKPLIKGQTKMTAFFRI